jgi:CubicO group peptidase (beta-lactamase class C family)
MDRHAMMKRLRIGPTRQIRSLSWIGLTAALVLSVAFALVVLGLTQALANTADEPDTNAPDFAAIDRYIKKEMEETRLPGVALGIVKGDEVVHLKGFGEADPSGREVTPQTPFLIASVTKSFTALAIMQLVEADKVELDAPVQRYLPWFRVADPEASAKITVRQLLNHTSGLPSLTEGEYERIAGSPTEDDVENLVRSLRSTQLTAPPGEIYQYSNVGYVTLAMIVQTVSEESYGEYLQHNIYGPLRMHRSFVSQAEAREHGLATGYRYWFGIPAAYDWSYSHAELGAGFTISSAEDLSHYLIAQLDGGSYRGAQILSSQGIAEMHRPAVATSVATQHGGPLSESYGMGWFVREYDDLTTVEHAGDAPNFHADLVLVPEDEWGVVLLANGRNGLRPERINGIATGVMDLLVSEELPPFPQGDLYMTILKVLVAVDAILLIGIIWSVVTLRRWHAQPERRARGWLRVGWRVVVPSLPYLLWALVCLIVVPLFFRWPLKGLLLEVPDFGYALVLSGAVALTWGALRTVLMILVLRKRDRPKGSDAPKRSGVPVEE